METTRAIRIALLLLLIFVGGGLCGWLMARQVAASSAVAPATGEFKRMSVAAREQKIFSELQRQLKLTPEQEAGILKLLESWGNEASQVERGAFRRKAALMNQYVPQMRTNLTPDQVVIYDRMVAEAKQKAQRR